MKKLPIILGAAMFLYAAAWAELHGYKVYAGISFTVAIIVILAAIDLD